MLICLSVSQCLPSLNPWWAGFVHQRDAGCSNRNSRASSISFRAESDASDTCMSDTAAEKFVVPRLWERGSTPRNEVVCLSTRFAMLDRAGYDTVSNCRHLQAAFGGRCPRNLLTAVKPSASIVSCSCGVSPSRMQDARRIRTRMYPSSMLVTPDLHPVLSFHKSCSAEFHVR